ncbi:MAG: M15 family metallopeptidase [Zoogloea sp.]|uniref:M15 family metallopeptidase n=1 Tax=Zoogloea sp. TaxID=49181 RepID=UPI00260777A0|nr:M15 family metallopeptidase [Zoogloea sp.]MDD2989798.1 M15 family metallopeptidase [Zoogloea sp.]
MISSRRIEDLRPDVQVLARAFVKKAAEAGIDVLIYCTLRDNESQAALYAQGRTKPGRIVTNARPGESFHNYGVAFDCVPFVNGKAAWDDDKAYAQLGRIGEALGLEWAGRWTGKLRERAHFQFTGGKSLAALKASAGRLA